ncbi:STAS-like domain-containing protein [Mucilaginibacter oryzae]|uniref:STAS-like domain-containing protein n=1 Tax=Mucilaginibacter oryzae TaxID=468058 RepID=UPI001476657D
MPISSSFFNSSFGELISQFGYDKVKDSIKIVGITAAQTKPNSRSSILILKLPSGR